VLDVRLDHGAQRVVLQVRELRDDVRVCKIELLAAGFWLLVAFNSVASAFRRKIQLWLPTSVEDRGGVLNPAPFCLANDPHKRQKRVSHTPRP
jgi:hypothetical protein